MLILLIAFAAVPSEALVTNFMPLIEDSWSPGDIAIQPPLSLEKLRPRIMGDPSNLTAIVTHAGKNQQEYIDMAIMLGISLRRYAPEYPRVALAIRGMNPEYRLLLAKAGWRVMTVDDITVCSNPGACNKNFNFRWKDSFEKLNAFRLPFRRVLYLDADTYLFSDRIHLLLNSTILDEAPHERRILMAPDACGKMSRYGGVEYNSGVMLFKPDVEVFQKMLQLISKSTGDDMLDQNIINLVYKEQKIAIDKTFDCIDPIGIVPGFKETCKQSTRCRKNEVVISHFTGMFKPTTTFPPYLRLVQRPETVTAACENTNHGGCAKWASYYCDLHLYQKHLTPELRYAIHQVGGCCLGNSHNNPECKYETRFNNATDGCPNAVILETPLLSRQVINVSKAAPEGMHDFRPIYQFENGNMTWYLYFYKAKGNWILGPDYRGDRGFAYAHTDAMCPNDATHWKTSTTYGFVSLGTTHVSPTTTACPDSFSVGKGEGWPEDIPYFWNGVYDKVEGSLEAMHGLRPFYQLRSTDSSEPVYMYYLMAKNSWVIGPNYKAYKGYAITRGDAYCPKDAVQWRVRMSSKQTHGASLMVKESNSSDKLKRHNLRPIVVQSERIADEGEDIIADIENDTDTTEQKEDEVENETSVADNQVESDTEITEQKEDKEEEEGIRLVREHIVALEGQVKRALNRNEFEKLKLLGRKLVPLWQKLQETTMESNTRDLKMWGASLRQSSH